MLFLNVFFGSMFFCLFASNHVIYYFLVLMLCFFFLRFVSSFVATATYCNQRFLRVRVCCLPSQLVCDY